MDDVLGHFLPIFDPGNIAFEAVNTGTLFNLTLGKFLSDFLNFFLLLNCPQAPRDPGQRGHRGPRPDDARHQDAGQALVQRRGRHQRHQDNLQDHRQAQPARPQGGNSKDFLHFGRFFGQFFVRLCGQIFDIAVQASPLTVKKCHCKRGPRPNTGTVSGEACTATSKNCPKNRPKCKKSFELPP